MRPLRFVLITFLALLTAIAASAAEPSAEVAAFSRFHREISTRLADSRERHRVLNAALASASYDATVNLLKAEEAKDRDAARAVAAIPVPAELKEYARDLERARLQAVGALEARTDRNGRVAAIREKSFAVMTEGIAALLKAGR